MAVQRQRARFRFYGELNDFLLPARRFVPFFHSFELPAPVKDIIESLGVPHTEINLILLNSAPSEFSQLVHNNDRISVYPAFRFLDVATLPRLRPCLQDHCFVLDVHLGRLARRLRLLGFDALYQTNSEDKDLARISHNEKRILLTRDCGLLKRNEVIYGYFVRATQTELQVREVLSRFNLQGAVTPFRRCLRCNALLTPVSKEEIVERLQTQTRLHFGEFRVCPACNRIYWAGSHYKNMCRFVDEILAE